MKDNILKLRNEGFTYRQIEAKLGCAKSTISYHCGKLQKEKSYGRTKERRGNKKRIVKIEGLVSSFKNKVRSFSDIVNCGEDKLSTQDAIDVLMEQGNRCYLTGEFLDFESKNQVHFDHKIPISKGGKCNKDNLGISTKKANLAKGDSTVEEFFSTCIKVLEFNGFTVSYGR